MNATESEVINEVKVKPAIGIIGTGWIGLDRMKAINKENILSIDAIADIENTNLLQAQEVAPNARLYNSMDALLKDNLSGVVIATPSALHAEQAIHALEKGMAVFCQKPLGRTAYETLKVVESAKKNNKLLGVDFSYRLTNGMQKIYKLVKSGELGKIYAANLIFHNAYGPDKKWFYDTRLSGGGCIIDLGSHLIDLALWILDFPDIANVYSSLYGQGRPIPLPVKETEDFAQVMLDTKTGISIQLSCSWNLQGGQDAIIEATFYGTEGGASFKNVNGSFYDFEAFRFFDKTRKELIAYPPDDWGGRAAVDWAQKLAHGKGFNPSAYEFVKVAEIIDRIYKRNL